MAPPNTSMVFKVRRREPELIKPACPTPQEFKPLSDIDDQGSIRFQIPFAQFYPNKPSQLGKDPVKVIREALAKALVPYYPLAGRLREGPNRKLVVDCDGEGVLFIEADADATLDQFGGSLRPPFPCFEEFLFDVPDSDDIVNCPLLLIQVTRLNCGGFIVATRLNHTITDSFGLLQFMLTMGEIARGASPPSTFPPWERHLLDARNPPTITCTHPEFNELNNTDNFSSFQYDELVHDSFFFGPTEISRLRKLVPPSLPKPTTFELLTACIWKCRTIALEFSPNEETRMVCCVNIRNNTDVGLPKGYYGNSFALSAAVATAQDVACKPFGYALELLKKAKENVTTEFIKSLADLMVIKGRPHYTFRGSFAVSDASRVGTENVDFGWGKAIFGGPARGDIGVIPGNTTLYVSCRNNIGQNGVGIPISLPKKAMKRFQVELDSLLGRNRPINIDKKYTNFISSAL